jgi:2-succinyl-6-hydroxy-2,4-cyclohexadiene-1-carboxylate synthase
MPSINITGTLHNYELTSPVADSQLPVLVFIHGWLLSHHYWQPLIKLFQSDYQCLSYDLRGFGDSLILSSENNYAIANSQANCRYNLKAYARDLCLLLQKLNIQKAWLVGHSLGGSIALQTAELNPEVVRGVICINSGGGIYLKEEFAKFRNAGQQLIKFRPSWLLYVPGLEFIFSRMMVSRPLDICWGHQRLKDFIKANEQAAKGALLESTTEEEVHYLPHLVSRLSQPVYFMAGIKDTVMELKYVHHLASFHTLFSCNGCNILEIEDCGHFAMLEHTETVFLAIDNLLKSNR